MVYSLYFFFLQFSRDHSELTYNEICHRTKKKKIRLIGQCTNRSAAYRNELRWYACHALLRFGMQMREMPRRRLNGNLERQYPGGTTGCTARRNNTGNINGDVIMIFLIKISILLLLSRLNISAILCLRKLMKLGIIFNYI